MVTMDQGMFAIATADGRLRVEFQQQEDRFTHRILLDQVEVARSVEGDASEPWPDSPPLQQLSLEEIKGNETILAVGSAGRSHWSLSCELEPGPKDAIWVRFDLAARCRDYHDEGVRSTYLVADSILVEPCDRELIENRDDVSGWRKVSIRPADAACGTSTVAGTPATFRWSYRIVAPS